MAVTEKKYQLGTAENQKFLQDVRDGLLSFGHQFPSPGGSSYYLGDDGTELAKKEAEELKNMDFQTAWTHTLKNAEFATSFVELLQEMLTGMDADDVIVSIDDLVDSVGGN